MRKKTFEEAQREVAEKFGDRIRLVEYEAAAKPCKVYCGEHGEQEMSKYYVMIRSDYGCPVCGRRSGGEKISQKLSERHKILSRTAELAERLPEIRERIPDFDELIETSLVVNPLSPDVSDIQVRYYPDIEFVGGYGNDAEVWEEPEYIPFDRDVLRVKRIKSEHVICFEVRGDSMFPTLPEGARVAIDESAKTVVNGQIYALIYKGGRKVKRLHKLNPQMLTLKSDNPAYEDENVFAKDVTIIGKVFWYQVVL
ncbi:S24 family peptidase [Neisseria leonii]|uniref:DUF723 domain-containing protein n=1 Tax=Neisseria leonii TaxID=2995413 RepID=A0A9X4E0I6_9NEIS|nr:S24 family peptidase [Neisseria sp. 51.81]MDD9326729.1 DUF723 domain-containing protein [Neisseria sp. 51.81]